MEILSKIKSRFILDILFDYIKDKNFKYKLIVHSKYYQNHLNINLMNYKYIYLDNSEELIGKIRHYLRQKTDKSISTDPEMKVLKEELLLLALMDCGIILIMMRRFK